MQIKVGIKGVYAIIDSEFYDTISQITWSEGGSRKGKQMYAVHQQWNKTIKKSKKISMHRFIYSLKFGKIKKGLQIDHINRNKVDNRICNLRLATHQQNGFNCEKKPTRAKISSKYKGVWFRSDYGRVKRWVAEIKFNYKKIVLGYYLTEEEAAIAYNKKAKELQGEYAVINKI